MSPRDSCVFGSWPRSASVTKVWESKPRIPTLSLQRKAWTRSLPSYLSKNPKPSVPAPWSSYPLAALSSDALGSARMLSSEDGLQSTDSLPLSCRSPFFLTGARLWGSDAGFLNVSRGPLRKVSLTTLLLFYDGICQDFPLTLFPQRTVIECAVTMLMGMTNTDAFCRLTRWRFRVILQLLCSHCREWKLKPLCGHQPCLLQLFSFMLQILTLKGPTGFVYLRIFAYI